MAAETTPADDQRVNALRLRQRKAPNAAATGPALRAADPARGTAVAVAYAGAAVAVAVVWIGQDGFAVDLDPAAFAVFLLAAAFAERIGLELGPRSWYSPSAPVILAAALLGGPLAGLSAGAAAQFLRTEVVWRRRLAEGGLASLQGLGAGVAAAAAAGQSRPVVAVACAVGASFAITTVGRALIISCRGLPTAASVWARGTLVDLVEALLLIPLLTTLAIAAAVSQPAVVATVASLLVAVALAERLRAGYGHRLAVEQENARRDQLTGAPNRRAFEELLAAEHARIVRGARPAALLVIDVDHFKSVNDRFGHAVGDEVLVGVLSRLAGGLRACDVVARWGGEEMTVLAPGLDRAADVDRLAEKLRSLVADAALPLSCGQLPVTVSVGATILDGSSGPDRALRRADAALYDAKRTRNTAVLELVESPGAAAAAESARAAAARA
jgi:diguanylate cyclase (GGDEF)-like protein